MSVLIRDLLLLQATLSYLDVEVLDFYFFLQIAFLSPSALEIIIYLNSYIYDKNCFL